MNKNKVRGLKWYLKKLGGSVLHFILYITLEKKLYELRPYWFGYIILNAGNCRVSWRLVFWSDTGESYWLCLPLWQHLSQSSFQVSAKLFNVTSCGFLICHAPLPIVNKCNIHLSKWQIHACWRVQTIIASKFLLMDFGHEFYKWDSIVSVEGLSDSNFQEWCTLCTNPSVLLPTSTWNEI